MAAEPKKQTGSKAARKPAAKRTAARPRAPKATAATGAQPVLLSGGNPQIAKADGDAPVQAYISAMPEWKHDIGRELDALIVRAVPKVKKAVRWNIWARPSGARRRRGGRRHTAPPTAR